MGFLEVPTMKEKTPVASAVFSPQSRIDTSWERKVILVHGTTKGKFSNKRITFHVSLLVYLNSVERDSFP